MPQPLWVHWPGGQLADRRTPWLVFGGGAAVYLVSYILFAWQQHSWSVLLVAFLLSGLGIGFAETAESTTVALVLPDHLRGNGFAVLGLVQAFGDLVATLVVGWLWATVSPTVAFRYAAAWMAAALIMSVAVRAPAPLSRVS